MNLNNASFLTSAPSAAKCPEEILPEFVFAGRSNVGKSSLINKLLNRKSLAKTSGKPGKTALINYYNIDNLLYFVDLPGYGYAEVSKKEKERWGNMINEYFNVRSEISAVFLVVDARHKPTADDLQMLDFIRYIRKKAIVIATKIDKLKAAEKEKNLLLIRETLKLGKSSVLLPFSAETGFGRHEIFEEICKIAGLDMPNLAI